MHFAWGLKIITLLINGVQLFKYKHDGHLLNGVSFFTCGFPSKIISSSSFTCRWKKCNSPKKMK